MKDMGAEYLDMVKIYNQWERKSVHAKEKKRKEKELLPVTF